MKSTVAKLRSKTAISGSRLTEVDRLKDAISHSIQENRFDEKATVFILTYCRKPELFYGTELIFKTLRVGFPTANVVIVDNASIPEARSEIELLAKNNDCLFEQIDNQGIRHHDFLENAIFAMADDDGPLIFVDPDICFWESCEDFEFEGLIAGRLGQGFEDGVTQTYTMPRLHTSFLWIPNVKKLRDAIWKAKFRHFDFEPFTPYSCAMNGKWYRYDTGASLYAAFSEKVSRFSEEYMDRYDHIYCGSHIDWLDSRFNPKLKEMTREIHRNAKEGNLAALKGIRARQDRIWKENIVEDI